MEQNVTTRRNLLKASAILAAGFSIAPNLSTLLKGNNLTDAGFAKTFGKKNPVGSGPKIKAKLNSNENPFGPSKKVKQAIIEAIDDSYLYPRDANKTFIKMIADYEKVSEDSILLGAGSSELLMATALVYGQKGGTVLSGEITYMSLIRNALSFGGEWEKAPMLKDYQYDFGAIKSQISDKTTLVYITNPNNPTGMLADTGALKSFCEEVSKTKPVFVDEAYIDYAPNPKTLSMIDCVRKGQNVIVARTFSKVQAFAGLRIGYLIALPETIKTISKYTTVGGTISATSIFGAIAAYNDEVFYNFSVSKNNESKAYLCKALSDMKYDFLPSATNFVIFPIKINGKKLVEMMMEKGVAVRNFEFDGKQWCRVSIGTMESMKLFVETLKSIPGTI
ncbi:MAG: histidinol-phosphate aminotransferase family protein [Cytophagales bacterium]|nr:MAG: histidinol-phosphate aminotransferase family protein [Cytophagales bacterium]